MRTCLSYIYVLAIVMCAFLGSGNIDGRSSWRKHLEQVPSITTRWVHDPDGHQATISDAHIEPYPLFSIFNEKHFNDHKIKPGHISYSHNGIKKTVPSKTLSDLCETLVQEVMAKKKCFSHFTILQKKNFNRRHMCGLLVLKFNEYPFVVKLFVENPTSLINYWCKGFEPIFFWNMGRGAGRHLCGLTRIRNRQIIQQRLSKMPFPDATLHLPRKWFWEPKQNNYIHITGTNIGKDRSTYVTKLPAIYAIIADFMSVADNTTLTTTEKDTLSMKLCNHLDLIIDPHANNYIFNTDATGKLHITLIDTEYFPVMVGLKEKKQFSTHLEWYTFLIEKCFADTFYQPKHARMQSLTQHNELLFSYG